MGESAKSSKADVRSDDLGLALDRLSLEQAEHDYEVANARIIDLTVRINAAYERAQSLRHEIAELQAQHTALQGVHHVAVTSTTYRLSGRIQSARNQIRRP